MCAPAVTTTSHPHVHTEAKGHSIDRRAFLKTGMALGAGGMLATIAPALPAGAFPKKARRTADLTHRLLREFPSFFGPQEVFDETVTDFDPDGFFTKRWTLLEHIGTHVDSPGHFDEGNRLVDDLTPDELVAPIVIIDIRDKAMDNPNATVHPDDLITFERRHGRIPEHALVCMNSGWSDKVGDAAEFRGGAGFPDLNFPGFSVEATRWLVDNRDPVGIGLDTMSLDPGNSETFAVHRDFLGSGRYGIESLANLDQIPPRGALGFVGPVPWEDGSGAPCRVFAVW